MKRSNDLRGRHGATGREGRSVARVITESETFWILEIYRNKGAFYLVEQWVRDGVFMSDHEANSKKMVVYPDGNETYLQAGEGT